MHLIIDGYNVLALRGGLSGDLEARREALLQQLAGYRTIKQHPITVVFDGWRQGLGAERHEHRAGVSVIYSKRGERADQVIGRLAAQYGADCTVVSGDQEVARTARAEAASVLSASEFAARLQRAQRSDAGEAERDDAPVRREKKGNPRKLPKAQRRRDRFLKRF
jgi:hypothetical protein